MRIFLIQILTEYSNLFTDELEKLPITHAIRPVVHPAHCIPVAVKDRVKTELDRIQESGVITPGSEPVDWNNKKPECTSIQETWTLLWKGYISPDIQYYEGSSRTYVKCNCVFGLGYKELFFWQVSLDHKSSMLSTFNTSFGYYRFLQMLWTQRCQWNVPGIHGTHFPLISPVQFLSVI